jgi:NADPH:quinone reductase-like Zn-dependent oxidoreductase
MKAVQINAYGGNEVLEINENASKPTLAQGQVLVEAHAASLNPVDGAVRAGYLKEMVPLSFPATLGGDFSGVVAEVGEAVSDLKIGDPVYGQAIVLNGGSGSLAQFVAANTTNTARKPQLVSYIEAAALPLAGVSALQALEEHIKLEAGQKILIHGGAGGVGTIAVQLAKSSGGYVATTVRADDKDYVKGLGADQMIDYQNEAFEEMLKEFDAVLDTVGGETTNKSFQVLKKGGILVSMLGQPDPELAEKYGVTAIGQSTNTNTQHLNRLAELVDAGKIKVQLGKVFPLEQARAAFKHLAESHPRGKVIVKIKD